MKEYFVKMLDSVPADWSKVPCAMLDETPWMKDYVPETCARVIFVPGDGFYCRMTCRESNPKAVHTAWFSDVYKDSCMEFFAQFDSTCPDYINMEMNSLGACLIAVGSDRNERTPIDQLCGHPFPVTAEVKSDEWSVTVHVTLADLEKIFGMKPETFVPGYSFRGNFYKCGDETAVEHYNMWSRVGTPSPDYHQSAFFGTLTLQA